MLDLNEYIAEKLRISGKGINPTKLDKCLDDVKLQSIAKNLKYETEKDYPGDMYAEYWLRLYPANITDRIVDLIYVRIDDIKKYSDMYKFLAICYMLINRIYPDTTTVVI